MASSTVPAPNSELHFLGGSDWLLCNESHRAFPSNLIHILNRLSKPILEIQYRIGLQVVYLLVFPCHFG